MSSAGFILRFLVALPFLACTFFATAVIFLSFLPESPNWSLVVISLANIVGSSLVVLASMGGWGQWRYLYAIIGLPAIQAECALNLVFAPRGFEAPLIILALVIPAAFFKFGLRRLGNTARTEQTAR